MEKSPGDVLLGRRNRVAARSIALAVLVSAILIISVWISRPFGGWLYGQDGQITIVFLLTAFAIGSAYVSNGVIVSILVVAVPVYGLVGSGAWFHWPIGDLPPSFMQRYVLVPLQWAVSYGTVLGVVGHVIGTGLRRLLA